MTKSPRRGRAINQKFRCNAQGAGEFAVLCLVRLISAALAAALIASDVSVVVEVGDDYRVGRARP